MIHIIDEIPFAKITCNLNKEELIDMEKNDPDQRSNCRFNYFGIGTTFLEHSKRERRRREKKANNNPLKKKTIYASQQDQNHFHLSKGNDHKQQILFFFIPMMTRINHNSEFSLPYLRFHSNRKTNQNVFIVFSLIE